MSRIYDNWERLVEATLRREQLRLSGLRTPSDLSLASSSSSSFSFSYSSPRVSSFNFSSLLVGDSFTYEQILQATNYLSNSNLMKHGRSGDLFYGVLEAGTQVIVKKIDLSSARRESYFLSEVEVLGKVSHSSLIPLLGHCLEHGKKKFLIYKYMPNMDLSSSLFTKTVLADDRGLPSLDWRTRLKIATGAAKCLSYLHHDCVPPLVHRDIQAKSILLDDDFEVRLGSLSEVCTEESDSNQNRVRQKKNQNRVARFLRLPKRSEQGISASSNATRAYDVYCFGKVLLELVSGKITAANDSTINEWREKILPFIVPENKKFVINIADPALDIDVHILREVWAVAFVAIACLCPEPSKRPQMAQILWILEDTESARFTTYGQFQPANYLNLKIFTHSNLRIFTLSELKKATRNFRNDALLGEDEFGRVYRGSLHKESVTEGGSEQIIAVRKLYSQPFENWQSVEHLPGRLYHPNIAQLLGYCWEKNEMLLVFEFIQNGSLLNHLFGGDSSSVQPLPWEIRLKILVGAAQGLAYLHEYGGQNFFNQENERQGFYRYFEPSNILLDHSYNAKISGFGLTKIEGCHLKDFINDSHPNALRGKYMYAAPESIATGDLYAKSDVYGFGLVLVAMLTGLRELDTRLEIGHSWFVAEIRGHLSNGNYLKLIMDSGLKGKYPLEAAVQIARLAQTCLEREAVERPSMKEVVEKLQSIETWAWSETLAASLSTSAME